MNEQLYITLKEKMEEYKERKIKELDKSMKEVFESNSFPKQYSALALCYHNTMEQGELGLLMLKDFLTNDFFIKNEGRNGVNYIVYEDENYQVLFSKSLCRTIEIVNKNNKSIGYNSKPPSENLLEYKAELEKWLTKKDFKTFKKLVQRKQVNWRKNIIAKCVLWYTVYKKTSQKDLDKVTRQINSIYAQIDRYEKDKKEYDKIQEEARTFVDSLTDLKAFKDDKWYIKCVNIYKKDTREPYTYE